MKKVLAVVLSIMMLVSLSFSASATPGAFLNSPSLNPAPRIISVTIDFEDCDAKLVLTPYSERDTLSEEGEKAIEDAYDEIRATDDLTELTTMLADLAKQMGIPGKNLAVSDLFDLDYINCDHEEHEKGHGYFTIKLEADTLKNFVGLLHSKDGKWELVKDVKVDGDTLTFRVNDFSPFAIVVNNSPAKPPLTGENGNMYLWGALMVVSAVAMIVCFKKYKKKEA